MDKFTKEEFDAIINILRKADELRKYAGEDDIEFVIGFLNKEYYSDLVGDNV